MSDDPYAEALGIEIAQIDSEHARLRVPFRDGNSNPGGALHGVTKELSLIHI